MTGRLLALLPACAAVVVTMTAGPHVAAPEAQAAATGTITGRVRLMSAAPANSIIRMGADPRCSRANPGKRLTQEVVLRSADGGLANAFVDLQGTFPATRVPARRPRSISEDASSCHAWSGSASARRSR